ncbi:MAG: glucosyltransferase domain-containing protein [Roseburia sp.]|nr:glucosyltransferase domain-containing protein [Roseburia sp.]MCM1098624.1 glucosyltransferase domain-containing protein [Ruminococcus flavefaciens]
MMSPTEVFQKIISKIRPKWRIAFVTAFVAGLLIHMPALLSDIPNHDGLDSLYFDQNMITSGRWFLMIACGFSSFYTVPWVIGLLGLLFLSLAAAALTELLEVEKTWAVMAVSALLPAFPALASTFAYVFTLDGYMLALLLAVLAVLFTKKRRYGFLPGAVCLALSLGIYQGYLAFAMILSFFSILLLAAGSGSVREKAAAAARYLCMGGLGAALYYVVLQILLKLQGKELASYQGIDSLGSGAVSEGLPAVLAKMYRDFFGFSLRGNVLYNNGISLAACVLLAVAAAVTLISLAVKRKWWKSLWFFGIMAVTAAALPLVTNVILLISPDVNYHLLMRYQWVLYLIGAVALVGGRQETDSRQCGAAEWMALAAAFALVFSYGVTDNIGYANLQKRYEKTYAYCVRLLDRIEQTPGYYQGIPIAMIGVVGDDEFPPTDLTLPVTSSMIGLNGDMLLYTGKNYREFIQNYLGATLNILPAEAMAEMYYDEAYMAMESFPGESSIRIMDGIMYIKTENVRE